MLISIWKANSTFMTFAPDGVCLNPYNTFTKQRKLILSIARISPQFMS